MQELSRGGLVSNDRFERDPRRKQELRMRGIADRIYRQVFGDDIQIKRTEKNEDATLDREFAIDITLILPTGQILLGQEKFLSHQYANFRSLTVEYYQNPITKEPGDWFKLAPQFYFTGYCNQNDTGFEPWVIADWARIVLLTHGNRINWRDNKNKDGSARASFRYTIMDKLPSECIIASSWTSGTVTTTQPPLFSY